ncbi:SPOR domain-containing protein [Ignavibacterium sp.]|uniref:SPOR domain-containing protein n=1 Tax=Ignavibacterium sp. TaxID=2651167 RepID=UPI00307EFD35
MTRAELIRKIAKKSGIPDSDIKLFFEILLKRLSAQLKKGQAAHIKEFGYFFLLKGKINQSRLNFIEDNIPDTFIDFILFSLNKDLKSSIEEGLIFNVPTIDDDDFHAIDTYFSLSIGKPLISVRGTSSDEFYVPTGGYELRRLIESKVEKIISEVEIISAYENNPPQIILTSQAFNSNRISLEMTEPELKLDEEIPDSFLETGEVKKEETLRIQHVAWDFGIDLSKEIEEETILDFEENNQAEKSDVASEQMIDKTEEQIIPEEVENTVEEIISEELPNISDQFYSSDELKITEQSELNSVNDVEKIVDEQSDEQSDIIEIKDDQGKETIEENEIPLQIETENVLSEKVEIEFEPLEEGIEEPTPKLFEEVKPEELHKDTIEEGFEEVESPLPEIDFDKQKSKDKISDKFVVVNEPKEEIPEEELPSLTVEESKNFEPEFDESKELKKVREELYSYQPKKSKVPLLIVLFGSIIIIGMLYFYITQIKNVAVKKTEPKLVLKTDDASLVERDFSVPVSYPYPKKETEETKSITQIDSQKVETKVFDSSSEQIEEKISEPKDIAANKETEPTKTQQPVKTISTQPPVENYERVAPNIFKYKDYYVVQVAAFRSNSIAENEAAKFRNKGYSAFVEKAEIQGMGVWFRVRVGNFSTLTEAQEFQSRVKL